MVAATAYFIGVDGGGTRCRARLCDDAGRVLGEGGAGPANLRLGLDASLAAVMEACRRAVAAAGLGEAALGRADACLALAGASEFAELAAARDRALPFRRAVLTTDAHAACLGAHGGGDGGIVIAGTGSIGWAIVGPCQYRVGGWGLPLSDEGSAAWLGCEAMRRVLRAYDGRVEWTGLLRRLFDDFSADPYAIVRWAASATPAEFGALAPLVAGFAARQDPEAVALLTRAACSIGDIAARLLVLGATRISLMGGLAPCLEPLLDGETRRHLVAPAGDALDGALLLAREAAR